MVTALFILAALLQLQERAEAGCLENPSIQFDEPKLTHQIYPLEWSNLDPNNRTLCPETPENRPPNRVNSTETLQALRQAMADHIPPLDAYLVEYRDDHGSGGAEYDQRIKYLSGFSGSSGYIWVTTEAAALWTDGRYFLQADQQMDCQWILMEQGTPGYPTAGEWLLSVLNEDANVGSDPRYVAISAWESYAAILSEKNIVMNEVVDLFDEFWLDRPARPNNPLIIHEYEYTGEHLSEKIGRIREKLTAEEADALVLTALDDTAWTFNLRGRDRATSPLFYSYGIITQDDVTLFLSNFIDLISPTDIQEHLNTNSDGTCTDREGICVAVKEYDTIIAELADLTQEPSINRIWLSPSSNYATLSAIQPKDMLAESPTQLMKSIKNDVQRERYKECQIRDSAALCRFAAFMENEIKQGHTWTEMTADDKLYEIRSEDPEFHSVSFESISAVGPNAAVIHYRADENTDRQINDQEVYLLDSGGQYTDGTTDVTRTFHYGTPSDTIMEAYTRVLIGAIELSLTVWPFGLHGTELDIRTRNPLYEHGWDYRHGTGHGLGYFLNVHEGPATIRMGYSSSHGPLYEGMFFSDEPGFYEDNVFGIRLETIVVVEKADTPNNFGNVQYLTFEEVTYVPFEPHMIKYELLETRHRKWLNEYNRRCVERTGQLLLDGGHTEAYDWLIARTEPIPEDPGWQKSDRSFNSAPYMVPSLSTLLILVLYSLFL